MIFFSPVIDGKMVPRDLDGLYQDKVNPVPYIVGINNTEGNGVLSMTDPEFAKGITKEALMTKLKEYIGEYFYVSLVK